MFYFLWEERDIKGKQKDNTLVFNKATLWRPTEDNTWVK